MGTRAHNAMQATESILKLHAVPRRWKSKGECSVACGLCSGHVFCIFLNLDFDTRKGGCSGFLKIGRWVASRVVKAGFLKAVKRLLYVVNKTNDCVKMHLTSVRLRASNCHY